MAHNLLQAGVNIPLEKPIPEDSIEERMNRDFSRLLQYAGPGKGIVRAYTEEGSIDAARYHYEIDREVYLVMALAEAALDGVRINLDPTVWVENVKAA